MRFSSLYILVPGLLHQAQAFSGNSAHDRSTGQFGSSDPYKGLARKLAHRDSAVAKATTSIAHFANSDPNQFDTDGNFIDATSCVIDFFEGSYLFYGLPFGCGARFCGIQSWSSPDLKTWQNNGMLLNGSDPAVLAICTSGNGGCGRPHIVYSEATKKYVLWVNAGSPGYVTFTSSEPTKGYVQTEARSTVGPMDTGIQTGIQAGDFAVRVINGVGYAAYSLIDFKTVGASIWPPFLQTLNIMELTPDLLNGTGQSYQVVSGADDLVDNEAESPDIFYREPYFYVAASNTCGFCDGSVMIMYRSKQISGPWERQILSGDTCGGQVDCVMTLPSPNGSNESTYVHLADLVRSAPITGIRQSQHGHQFQKLVFNKDGSIKDFDCSPDKIHDVPYITGNTSTSGIATSTKHGSGVDAKYQLVCDIPQYSLYQTFTAASSGNLTEVGVNIGAGVISNTVEMPLTYAVFRYSNDTALTSARYVYETLASASIVQSTLSHALPVKKLAVGKAIKEGDKLGIAITTMSGTTQICTGRTNTTEAGKKLFANGPGQVSPRGPDGQTSPVIELKGEELKWYATVV